MILREKEGLDNITDKLLPLKEMATPQQKDQLARLYISTVLELNDSVLKRLLHDDNDIIAWREFGEAIKSISHIAEVIRFDRFWSGVKEIFPDILTQDEINILCQNSGHEKILDLLCLLDGGNSTNLAKKTTLNASYFANNFKLRNH